MNIRILYLEILCLLLLVYPVAVPNILSNMIYNNIKHDKTKQKYSFWIFCIVFFTLTVWLPTYLLGCKSLTLINASVWHGLVGILAAPLLIIVEILVGILASLAAKKKIGEITVDERIGKESPFIWLCVILVAILEELLFRGICFEILGSLDVNIYVCIVISALLYAINHCHEGVVTTLQKVLTGAFLASMYVLSGYNIIVPILAHVFENVILIVWSKRKNEG
ncbi:CAAX protease self-immunity [Lachnospiraceae bacterium YSD2013]|nr:CAAX protease self-immunity [Lachnospiraceae bacterium YSD2013]